MKILRALRDVVDHVCIRLYVAAQIMAVNEPVRLRAMITSAVVLVGTLVPALAVGSVASTIAGVLVSALVLVAGEDARSKVSPTEK
ncbi:hypothetical protein HEK616_40850 [Streptomyces nigrescens]|uniref:Integral membrane protein n=1 Tax=Streptomyces nigrescens TaxID=1920 RepID=A0ABM7ZW57_STRNI|nr:hypothetical protein [Streptomyces nigrescens]BDM70598.1 hypothetical protein HEK616_40850 [Streptomyces nigrescens]